MATIALSAETPIIKLNQFDLTSDFNSSSSTINYLPVVEYYYSVNVSIPELTVYAAWNGSSWRDAGNQVVTRVPGSSPLPGILILPGTAIGDKYSIYKIGYSSYTSAQPTLTYNFATTISDVNPASVRARPLFLLGSSAVFGAPTQIGAVQTLDLTANNYTITKSFSMTTGTTQATGPSNPFTITLVAEVASGYTIPNMIIQDILTPELQFVSANIPLSFYDPATQTLQWNFGNVTGPSVTTLFLTVHGREFLNGTMTPVLDPINPASFINVNNSASLLDGVTNLVDSNVVTIPLSPIATSKIYSRIGGPQQAGSFLRYRIGITTSDYFSMNNLMVTDRMSAGQTFQDVGSANPPTYTSIPLAASQVVVTPVFLPPLSSPPYDPTTQVVFKEFGGLSFASSAELVYYTELTGVYTPSLPTDPSMILAAGDYVNNDITLDATNDVPGGGSVVETASSKYTYPVPTKEKTVYAINGLPFTEMPPTVLPGDLVTYRLMLTFSVGNFINLKIYDFFPSPIIDVDGFGANPPIDPFGGIPANWTISYGPTNTLLATVTKDSTSNSLVFDYGTRLVNPDTPEIADILLTVVVNTQPFSPDLLFSNQLYYDFVNSTDTTISDYTPESLILGNPDLYIKKSVVNVSSPSTITYTPNNSVAYTANFGPFQPLILAPPPLTTPVTEAYFDSFVTMNASNLNESDGVRYVILVCNKGSADAYAPAVEDLLPANTTTQGFAWYKSDGSPITQYTTTGTYTWTFNADYVIAPGEVIILIYQIRLGDTLYCPTVSVANKVDITAWTNIEGGLNFVTTIGAVRTSTANVTTKRIMMSTITTIPPGPGLPTLSNVTLGQTVTQSLTLTFPIFVNTPNTLTISINQGVSLTYLSTFLSPDIIITGSSVPLPVVGSSLVFDFGTITSAGTASTITVIYSVLFDGSNATLIDGVKPVVTATFRPGPCTISRTFTFNIVEPKLEITKSVVSRIAAAGVTTVRYEIIVKNMGTSDAYTVSIEDFAPVGFVPPLTFVSAIPAIVVATPGDPLVLSVTGALAVGADVKILVEGTYVSIVAGTTVTNIACVTYTSLVVGVPPTQRNYGPTCASAQFFIGISLTVESKNHTYTGHNSDNPLNTGVVGAPGDVIELTYTLITEPNASAIVVLVETTGLLGLASQGGDSYLLDTVAELGENQLALNSNFDPFTGILTFNDFEPLIAIGTSRFVQWKYYVRISNTEYNLAGVAYNPITVGYNLVGTDLIEIQRIIPPVSTFTVVEPRLDIIKSDPTLPIVNGEPVTYTITVNNSADQWVSSGWDILISDKTLQNMVTQITNIASTSLFAISSNIYWPEVIGRKILPGETVTFDITLIPSFTTKSKFCNTASVEWKSIDPFNIDVGYARTGYDGPVGLNDYYRQNTVCTQLVPYELTKSIITPGPYVVGQPIQFGIVITIPQGITNLSIEDAFSGLTNVSATIITVAADSFGLLQADFEGVLDNLVVTPTNPITMTTVSLVPAGAVYTSFLILISVETTDSTDFINTANAFGLSSTVSDVIGRPDLYIIKTIETNPIIANEPIYYHIEVGHNAGSTSYGWNATVVDVPNQIQSYGSLTAYTSPPSTINVSSLPAGYEVTVVGEFPLGAKLFIDYSILLPAPPLSNVVSNVATLSYNISEYVADLVTTEASTENVLGDGQLALEKTTRTVNVQPGQLAIWDVIVRNEGASTLTNIILQETSLPAWFGPLVAPSAAWISIPGGYQLTVPLLAPGETLIFPFAMRVLSVGADSYTNVVTSDQISRSSTIYISLPHPPPPQPQPQPPKLNVSKTLSRKCENSLTYSIEVTNAGTEVYNNFIELIDTFPCELSWNRNDWTQLGDNKVQLKPYVTIQPGQAQTFLIGFCIARNCGGCIKNTVSLYDSSHSFLSKDKCYTNLN